MFVIRPNDSYEVKPFISGFESLQKEVGGSVSLVNAGKFMGFVDEEGVYKDEQHQNALAAYVLDFLGNDLRCFLAGIIRGPLVIIGHGERGLTEEQTTAFKKLCDFFIAGGEIAPAETACLVPRKLDLNGKVKKTRKRAKPYTKKT